MSEQILKQQLEENLPKIEEQAEPSESINPISVEKDQQASEIKSSAEPPIKNPSPVSFRKQEVSFMIQPEDEKSHLSPSKINAQPQQEGEKLRGFLLICLLKQGETQGISCMKPRNMQITATASGH